MNSRVKPARSKGSDFFMAGLVSEIERLPSTIATVAWRIDVRRRDAAWHVTGGHFCGVSAAHAVVVVRVAAFIFHIVGVSAIRCSLTRIHGEVTSVRGWSDAGNEAQRGEEDESKKFTIHVRRVREV